MMGLTKEAIGVKYDMPIYIGANLQNWGLQWLWYFLFAHHMHVLFVYTDHFLISPSILFHAEVFRV